MLRLTGLSISLFMLAFVAAGCGDEADIDAPTVNFKVVDSNQAACYDKDGKTITCPAEGVTYYGQDAQYTTTAPSYQASSDGAVVVDMNTGLMWQKAHNPTKVKQVTAVSTCSSLDLGGYTDWRLPSIKELFSLADFRGRVGGGFFISSSLDFAIPTTGALTGTHSYKMMGQTWSSTLRPDKGTVAYFFNFLDGHIKSSNVDNDQQTHFYRCVRGSSAAFANKLSKNGDGTVTDSATGLVWQEAAGSSGGKSQFTWQEALAYCEGLTLGGKTDWRLPDVKEQQSIVDYTKTEPAIDTSAFTQTLASGTSSFFWTSTSHGNYLDWAAYVCMGVCSSVTGTDIHGPGAQRADPKYDDGTDYTAGKGDQKDVIQINNYVRCVRGGIS
jgi:hypothetical protein